MREDGYGQSYSTWKALPDMREGRSGFNPCLFSGSVYLCGGNSSQLVEAFSPQTDTFLPLQLQLPENSHRCVYVHNNLLVVHSYQYISKFTAGQGGQLIQHSQVRTQTPVNKHSNSQPVVDTTQGLFFLFQLTKVVSFNMETGAQVRTFT